MAEGMRILCVPLITAGNAARGSDIHGYRALLRGFERLGPVHAYWWLRRGDEGRWPYESKTETAFYRERTTPKYGEMLGEFMAMADIETIQALFSWRIGAYPIHAIFTSRASLAPQMALSLGVEGWDVRPPVVVMEPKVYGPNDTARHNVTTEWQMLCRAVGYALCYGVYWNPHDRDEALAAAEYVAQPWVAKEFERRSLVIWHPIEVPSGVDIGWRLAHPEGRKRMVFVGRLNTNKRWRLVLEIMGRVMQSRQDAEVWLHSGTDAYKRLAGEEADHRWHRTSQALPRDEYLRFLSTSHAGLYMSRDEGANIAVQELLVAGVTMVLPDRPWVHRMFRPLEYPYTFRRVSEAAAMLDWVLDHYEETFHALAPIREYLLRTRGWDQLYDRVETLHGWLWDDLHRQSQRFFCSDALRAEVSRMIEEGAEITFSEILRRLWKQPVRPGRRFRSTIGHYWAFRRYDTFTSADPLFRKEAR